MFSAHPMEMPAFNQIEAAVAFITKLVVAVIIVHTIPREAVLVTDATEAASDGDLIHMTHHNPGHLEDTTTSHDLHMDLTKDVYPTHIAGAGPDH